MSAKEKGTVKMNILIVSSEAWRDTNNGGNVLSNIFSAFPNADIAQIYCSGELPQNSICKKYYQIADSMLLKKTKGRVLEEKCYNFDLSDESDVIENRIKRKIPNFLREFAMFAREALWSLSNWKTSQLKNFICDFKPDIIFAPCYSYFHISKLALYVKSVAKCPMISYISDDNYSLKQLNFDPIFYINRLITRKWIRQHFSESDLVYTMTDMQKNEYEALFNKPMKVLCKSAEFSADKKEICTPVRFIYAGGLYLNRWKTLYKLSKVIKKINVTEKKAELHIYSGSKLSRRIENKLNDGMNSFLHSSIPYSSLTEQYKNSHIAVLTESFDLKNRLITRLSFSTKIIDCMNSGCAILAIGPDTQAGISYLKENDGAVCVSDINDLYSAVNRLINDKKMIGSYADKAKKLGVKNHKKADIEKSIQQDFQNIIGG